MLKFCSGVPDFILQYHPREDWPGSAVVYIKASLAERGWGGRRGFVQHLAAIPEPPGL